MEALVGALIGALIGLIGVILVSVIGYATVITTLVVEHRRWRQEFKLHYLITERIRREKQCDKIRKLLEKGLTEDSFTVELATTIYQRLPPKTLMLIHKAWKGRDLSQFEGKQKLYREVSKILGAYLQDIDKQIEELSQ